MPRRERPLDSADGVLGRFAADLRTLRERAGSPPYRELSKVAHFSATVLSEAAGGRKLPSLAVTVAYVTACGGDPSEWRERWHATRIELVGADPAEVEDGASPYLGLNAFQPEDAGRFFGREELVADILSRMRDQRFLGVFGASGSGKSSLLRAGLVGRMAAQDRSAIVFTPGPNPLDECAVHLAVFARASVNVLRGEIAADPACLHLWVRQALLERQSEHDLLIVVDQFEELFTLCRDDQQRDRFISALTLAATQPRSRTRVVIGVRADFYGHCGRFPRLTAALRDAQVLVGELTADELRCVITEPATRAGCTVETALVSRLVADATGQPAVLPLVSHALLETWHRRRGTRLTLEGYVEAGGMHDAIARSAENVYAELDSAQQATAKQIFLRLTALGDGTEDTKRRLALRELDESQDLLERLAQARLITLGHDYAEIAHEALIRCWPRLRDWLGENRDGLRVHRQLTEATDAWEALGHDPGSLYRGVRLALARDWARANDSSLTARERGFIEASEAEEAAALADARRRNRRLRQLVALLSVLLLLAAGSIVYAVQAQRTTTTQRNLAIARKAVSDATAMRGENPALSVQLSLAAYRNVPTAETRDNLLSTFGTPYANRIVPPDAQTDTAIALQPGGRLLAVGSTRTLTLWDVSDIHRPRELKSLPFAEHVRQVVFLPDGRTLAVRVDDRTVRLWNVSDPGNAHEVGSVSKGELTTSWVMASPDGRTLAVSHGDRTVRLWDVSAPREPRELATLVMNSSNPCGVAFSPDASRLVIADGHVARLWDVSNPSDPLARGTMSGHRDLMTGAAFSPDGRTVATGGLDHEVRLWDVSDLAAPRGLATITGPTATINGIGFSPDGRTLATTSGETRLWDVGDLAHPKPLITFPLGLWGVEFSADGNVLITSDGDTAVRIHDLRELPLVGHHDLVSSLAFSPDGRVLATSSWDKTVRLWDVTDPRDRRPITTLTHHTGYVRSVAFSPDGRVLATSGDDGTIWLFNVMDPLRPTKTHVLQPKGHEVLSIAFSGDGRWMAAGLPRSVVLFDLTDPRGPQELTRITGLEGTAWTVAISPDGRTLAAGDDGRRLAWLWDVSDLRRPRDLPSPDGYIPAGGAFSPDGRVLATMHGSQVRALDATDPGRTLFAVDRHSGFSSVAFSPDSRTMIASGFDKTMRRWDITGSAPRELGAFVGHPFGAVAFHRDGHTVASGGNDFIVRLWETDIRRVEARVCEVAHPRITEADWQRYFPDLAFTPPC